MTRKIDKNSRQYILLLIMSHQPANFGDEGSSLTSEKLKKKKVPLKLIGEK